MKIIIETLKVLGTTVAAAVVGYLLWFLIDWGIPYLLSVSWWGFIIYLIFAGGFITAIFGGLSSLLVIPVALLTKENMVAKILNMIVFGFWGYCSFMVPLHVPGEFTFLQWIITFSLWGLIVTAFIGLMFFPFSIDDDF